jgi:hypothetical protein
MPRRLEQCPRQPLGMRSSNGPTRLSSRLQLSEAADVGDEPRRFRLRPEFTPLELAEALEQTGAAAQLSLRDRSCRPAT